MVSLAPVLLLTTLLIHVRKQYFHKLNVLGRGEGGGGREEGGGRREEGGGRREEGGGRREEGGGRRDERGTSSAHTIREYLHFIMCMGSKSLHVA